MFPGLSRRIRKKKVGDAPGTLEYIGDKKEEKIRIRVIDYSNEIFEEKTVDEVEECFPLSKTDSVSWINIDGVHDVEIIEKIGKCFDVHSLALEDIVHTDQRPKLDDYDKYIFLVAKMVDFDKKENEMTIEQISFILGPNYVITFQEREGDVFDAVRARIKSGKGRIRKMGTDYLLYSLLDAIVDSYFIILEALGEKIEVIEEELVEKPSPETLHTIHKMKRDMIYLRRSIWPLREVVSHLERLESEIVTDNVHIFLRDLYDHTIRVIDTVESYRDLVSGMLDIYLSSVSNKMNEVMKVLTVIATIFIPLSFIAGVYGMNFQYMPELAIWWFYPMVWAIIILIIVTMLGYFKYKSWI
jgi:magnesium transporter